MDVFALVGLFIHKGARTVNLAAPSLESFAQSVKKYDVTVARLSNAFLADLANGDQVDLSKLKHVFIDSIWPEEATIKAMKKKYPNVTIETTYAATTWAMIGKEKSKGFKLLPGTQAKILDTSQEDFEELAVGKEGYLFLKGEQIPKSYYFHEESNKKRYDEFGYFNTLDRAKMTKDGMITVLPRAQGEN